LSDDTKQGIFLPSFFSIHSQIEIPTRDENRLWFRHQLQRKRARQRVLPALAREKKKKSETMYHTGKGTDLLDVGRIAR